jgi:very-short-patch-repair endonuclease/predicted transcriptional regulator of viral defense system
MATEGSSTAVEPQSTSPRGVDRRIGVVADRQHGVITTDQLRATGLSDSAIRDRTRAGRLHRHHLGVYSLLPSLPSPEARMLAAVLACGPAAVLSHRWALVLWAICEPRPGPIDVTTSTRRGKGDPRIGAHRSRNLPAPDVTRRHGIPVTTVHRSLLDYAATAGELDLQRAVDEATYLRLLHRRSLVALLDERRGVRGARALRRAIKADRPPARTRSELERRFLELITGAGLEQPLVNHRIRTPDGTFEVDFCWPRRRLIIETDGYRAHGPERRFNSDRDRDQCLGSVGWHVYRFYPDQVFERPEQTVERVAALLHPATAHR